MRGDRGFVGLLLGTAVLVALLPGPARSDVDDANALASAGFEEGRAMWTRGRLVSSPVRSGTRALRLVSARAPRASGQVVPVSGGTTYDVTGWIRVKALRGGARLEIRWRDGAGSLLWMDRVGPVRSGTSQWNRSSAALTAPVHASEARFMLRLRREPDGAGRAWFDDLSLQPRVATTEPSSEPSIDDPACAAPGAVHVSAGANLARAVTAKSAGTTFCLGAGTFVVTEKIVAEPGDSFIGAGPGRTFLRPYGVDRPRNGFVPPGASDAGKTPVTYRGLSIGGFTAKLGDTACKSSCGIAIFNKGDPRTGGAVLEHVRCHDNGTACIASGWGAVRAVDFECDHNGFHPRSLKTDYRSSACMKMIEGSLSLTDSWIHDNTADAIWCDHCARTVFQIENSVIENNGRAAVVWEVSGHFVVGDRMIVRNNVIRSNGDRCDLVGSTIAAGVVVSNARNVLIENNTFGQNAACVAFWGVRAVKVIDLTTRAPRVANVVIRSNTLNGDKIQDCSARGVTCVDNS